MLLVIFSARALPWIGGGRVRSPVGACPSHPRQYHGASRLPTPSALPIPCPLPCAQRPPLQSVREVLERVSTQFLVFPRGISDFCCSNHAAASNVVLSMVKALLRDNNHYSNRAFVPVLHLWFVELATEPMRHDSIIGFLLWRQTLRAALASRARFQYKTDQMGGKIIHSS